MEAQGMGKFYDQSIIPAELRRNFDVYDRIKQLGMVVSTDVDYNSGPAVVNGYSGRWQSVFGGGIGSLAQDGEDPGGYSGVHARSAIGGFTGRFSLEPEIIVTIPPALAQAIIKN